MISEDRKPLVLRGARQTGKTTLVQLLSQEFSATVTLNLERAADRRPWAGEPDARELLRNIEVIKECRIIPRQTLLFIDEIQYEPKAIQSLRYLYEEVPELHVIVTGSLMEVGLKEKGFSFPVGRVSFLYLYPLSFDEFLAALDYRELLEELSSFRWNSDISPALHQRSLELFAEYLYIGGMPEPVRHFQEEQSYLALRDSKEGLLTSFEEDIPKYARTAQVPYLQFLIRQAPLYAGKRIQYANFAESNYRSREMRQSFETLERAMILQRAFGTNEVRPPALLNTRVKPKLLYLDVGLVTYRLGVELDSLKMKELNDLFRGALAEQVVGQELMAQNAQRREAPVFWCRNQPGATAEIDYCLELRGLTIPLEVKSGKSGRLRSLWQFMQQAPHPYAVRMYSGPLRLDKVETPGGNNFQLLSVPFYLAYRLPHILAEWIGEDR